MKKSKTLVIMAAGLGSRFGGLKQIEPIDDKNHFIIDYSIFDAVREGFNKVVFIIKKEHLEVFKKSIGERISKYVQVDYAFQGIDSYVPDGLDTKGRTKPWGTGHAVLCAKDQVQGDFAVINSDDFYGRDGFKVASKFFDDYDNEKLYGLVGYMAGNTLTENGTVKRGVCDVRDGYLETVDESQLERINGKIKAVSLATKEESFIEDNHPVSMNLICFKHNYFEALETAFNEFLHSDKTNIEKDEFLILNQVETAKRLFNVKMKVLSTTAVWQGVTYKEDKEKVVQSIKNLRDKGEYPIVLWNK